MANEFFQSLVMPRRWSICGITVHALSCWHYYALEQAGNAYAWPESSVIVPTKDDAAGLVMLCRLDWSQGKRLFTDTRFATRESRRAYNAIKNLDFDALNEACRDYSDTCRNMPEVWIEENKGGGPRKTLGGPHQYHVVRMLCKEYGYSISDAWNECYAVARCYFDISREAQGGCEIASDRSLALVAKAKEIANG